MKHPKTFGSRFLNADSSLTALGLCWNPPDSQQSYSTAQQDPARIVSKMYKCSKNQMQAGSTPTGSLFFLVLNKTWANGSVVTELVFLSCYNCACFKMLGPTNEFYKANLKIPESSWPHGTEGNNTSHREICSFSQTHKIQIHPKRQNASTAESSAFADGLTGRQTASDFTKMHKKDFILVLKMCDTISQTKLRNTD